MSHMTRDDPFDALVVGASQTSHKFPCVGTMWIGLCKESGVVIDLRLCTASVCTFLIASSISLELLRNHFREFEEGRRLKRVVFVACSEPGSTDASKDILPICD